MLTAGLSVACLQAELQGSEGAQFHPNLTTPKRSQVIQKGTNPLLDSYSAFYDSSAIKEQTKHIEIEL